MHASTFCERCCEQVAGHPPEVSPPFKEFFSMVMKLCGLGLLAIVQLIGYICFFSVAIWLHPIGGAPTPKQRREEEEKRSREASRQEEHQRKQVEAAHRRAQANDSRDTTDQKAPDLGSSDQSLFNDLEKEVEKLNTIRNEFTYDSHKGLGDDDHMIDELNDLSRRRQQGTVDKTSAMQEQLKIADELHKKRTAEVLKYRERQSVSNQIEDVASNLRRAQRDLERADRDNDSQKASKLYGEVNSLHHKLCDLEAKYRSLV